LASALEVGIGVDADGAVAVHHASLPGSAPVALLRPGAPAAELRIAGRTAARIVKCLPL
ncbi:PduH protein, partial [Pseudonocardia sp. KRD-291]|nr:PduH protein [Pseudonocardia sp. KRD291]